MEHNTPTQTEGITPLAILLQFLSIAGWLFTSLTKSDVGFVASMVVSTFAVRHYYYAIKKTKLELEKLDKHKETEQSNTLRGKTVFKAAIIALFIIGVALCLYGIINGLSK